MTHKGGRPKKTLKDLPKNWKSIILRNMKVGASKQEIKLELSISNDLFERFFKENEEFSETIKRGVEMSEGWWMKQGRINLENRKFSPVLWYMNMKNRFGWKDKAELEHNENIGVIVLDNKWNQKKNN